MTDLIPGFDANGLLPVGDYEVTFDELRRSTLVQGPANLAAYPNCDSSWRGWLVDQLETMTRQLSSRAIPALRWSEFGHQGSTWKRIGIPFGVSPIAS